MFQQGMYQDRTVFCQICVILAIFFACTCIGMLPIIVLQLMASDPTSPEMIRINLCIQDVFLFILTPILAQYFLFREPAVQTFRLNKAPVSIFLTGMAAIVLLTPVIDWLAEWNKGLQLPASLEALQLKMEEYERSAELLLNTILHDDRLAILGVNIFIIAVLASVGEELLFRGLIQRLLQRWTGGRIHLAVWITAFIFSAIHFQFFGFVPRVLLGALLGYLFAYSGSLWVCIAAHTFNNALTVLSLPGQPYNATWEWTHYLQHTSNSPLMIVTSILFTGMCMVVMYRFHSARKKHKAAVEKPQA